MREKKGNSILTGKLLLATILELLFICEMADAQVLIHTFEVQDTKDLKALVEYAPNEAPIIHAHRGGAAKGFPENCLATFENTLRYTPAIMEIDPRLTKDSVVVLMHDATLDRTSTGTGKVSDYTWEELKELRLKDPEGNVTPYRIPLLWEVFEWCKGKTVLNVDEKDVPYEMIADLIHKYRVEGNVLLTVHNAKEAARYHALDRDFLFEIYVLNPETIAEYEAAGIPWDQVLAYNGPVDKPENKIIYDALHRRGVRCMISGAPSIDGEYYEGNMDAFINIIMHGADNIESNIPLEAAKVVEGYSIPKNKKRNYGIQEIQLSDAYSLPDVSSGDVHLKRRRTK